MCLPTDEQSLSESLHHAIINTNDDVRMSKKVKLDNLNLPVNCCQSENDRSV